LLELEKLSPHFRDVSGYESPDFFRQQLSDPETDSKSTLYFENSELSFEKSWYFEHWKNEHLATRENVRLLLLFFPFSFFFLFFYF
jgi:hypothetical protein